MSQKIVSLLTKHENYYNNKKPIHSFKYEDNSLFYSNLNDIVIHNDKKRAVDFEKEIFTNKHGDYLKLSKPNMSSVEDIFSCDVVLSFYDVVKSETQQILQKIAIKGVNMTELMDDLNKNNINVQQLLIELQKHGKNLAPVIEYLASQNIEISKLMVILFRNNVTVPNLLKNPYVYDLLKQSPTYSWIIGNTARPKEVTINSTNTEKKLIKRIQLYILFKIKHDDVSILSINYNKLK